jgi:hypothetical protein
MVMRNHDLSSSLFQGRGDLRLGGEDPLVLRAFDDCRR